MKTKTQVPGLDLVRFMTAFVVMMYHLCYWRNGQLPAESDTLNAMWRFGWIGVEVFFTISGFVIAFSAEAATPKGFARSRILRLAPTVWICATLTLAAKWLWPDDVTDLLARYLATMVLKPVGSHIDVVYWTLTVEVAFYLLVFVILRLAHFRVLIPLMMAVGLLSALFDVLVALGQMLPGKHGALLDALAALAGKHSSRLLLLRHGCFFALGMLVWARATPYRPRWAAGIAALLGIGTVFEVLYTIGLHRAEFPAEHFEAWPIVATWLVGLALVWVASLPGTTALLQSARTRRTLRSLGLMTFPLYLVHNEIGLALQRQAAALVGDGWPSKLVAVAACLALAFVVYQIIEPPLARALARGLGRIDAALAGSQLTARAWKSLFPRRAAG